MGFLIMKFIGCLLLFYAADYKREPKIKPYGKLYWEISAILFIAFLLIEYSHN